MKEEVLATSTDSPRRVVLIPAYNEERFIGSVVVEAIHHAEVVIVIDDGSTDETATAAQAAGAIVVRHEHNQGKGGALNTGFRKAREFNPTVVITLDGDGQHLPGEMSLVGAPIISGEADIVVGSRYLKCQSQVPWIRILGHLLFNLMTSAASGIAVTDSQSGFRAFSPRALQTISFQSQGFAVESEMQFLAHDHHLQLKEVPITILYNDKPKRNVFSQGWAVLNGMIRLIRQHRPLLFFGPPGLIAFGLSLLWGVLAADLYAQDQALAVAFTFLSAILAVMSTRALFSSISQRSIRRPALDLNRQRRGL